MSTATKRPRAEVLSAAERLLEALRPGCVRVELAGSLRRQTPAVGDVELVAIPKVEVLEEVDHEDLFKRPVKVEYNLLWKALEAVHGLKFRLMGEKYRSFYWPLGQGDDVVQVDLFTAKPDSWGWIHLVRTGSADFSHHVAKKLNEAGYTSQDGQIHKGDLRYVEDRWKLVPVGAPLKTPTEQDVFDLARIPFREPKQRF